ncbi:MAG TPA: universal stress protein [Steroidobacteraceae bacterium]|nr:universal stress protein [Steroidobacteraceae bacterium]
MDKLTSILVVLDPTDDSRHVLNKAMILARHFRARLELFLCDSENAFALSHSYDRKGVAAAREACLASGYRYLDAVRRMLAEDVEITTHVACESPLYEAIVRRALETRPDLVIKGAAGSRALRPFSLGANDWQLARTCPTALMLTRGEPWSARPRFAAAVDVSDPDNGALARTILQAAGFLAGGCNGDLEVVFSSAAPDRETREAQAEALSRLVNEFRVGRQHSTLLEGAAEETLPEFAARKEFDVLVMGALTRKRGLTALVGTLTSKLVDALDCDFVLVKPESYACPQISPRQPESQACARA